MKHHFSDFLDREGDYWTIVPNRERYAYEISNVPAASKEITIITFSNRSTLPAKAGLADINSAVTPVT